MMSDCATQKMSPDFAPAVSHAQTWIAAFGLVTGLGAVVASSCCVIPLGLAAVGVSAGALSILETVTEWRVPFLGVSALAIVMGWRAWWRKSRACCMTGRTHLSQPRSGATLGLLLSASVIVVLAANWSYIDPALLKLFKGR